MNKLTKREFVIISTFVIIMLFIIVGKYYYNESKEIVFEHEMEETKEIDEDIKKTDITISKKEKLIIVDVCGEVRRPGIVKIKEGDRVVDAVTLAGGLLNTADRKQVNMARILIDGEQIYVPKIGENLTSINISGSVAKASIKSDKININTASKAELESLDGIGESLAKRIIEYRQNNGIFQDIRDIKKVSGIGDKKFSAIKEHICLN
ncbi:competence protein ComEA [Crassaminicella thermophila]|uniref:Competence protein ComEA n=1 Tax=Crassaminicella thermophila TaxID=2599308 RepID=A0A5C0SFL1_CRATE|nr:helix-hairpin-helix domain-containing protein [Crassaminicella thermophila]QEK12048.1 competence protein ComEA [Crassaminicella thermophila]